MFRRALFRVSRQIRNEAQAVFFGNHQVHFTLLPSRERFIRAWTEFQDESAIAAIRKVSLSTFKGRTWAEWFVIDLSQDPPTVDARTKNKWKESRRQPILDILLRLTRVEGKSVLTKTALWEILNAVGWYPDRSPFISGYNTPIS